MVNGEQSHEDIVAVLTEQHDRVRDLLNQLHDAIAPLGESTRAVAGPIEDLVRLLAVHETVEEEVVYPVLKTQLQAAHVVDPRLAEEGEAKRMLSKLERAAAAAVELPDALAEFEQAVLAHAEREEAEVFPLLQDRLDADQRRDMAVAFRAAEAVAPTHPHPHAPESAVGNLLLGPVLATIDRVRDFTRQRAGSRRPS
jgi:hemerythrin-like domain-containing protein